MNDCLTEIQELIIEESGDIELSHRILTECVNGSQKVRFISPLITTTETSKLLK